MPAGARFARLRRSGVPIAPRGVDAGGARVFRREAASRRCGGTRVRRSLALPDAPPGDGEQRDEHDDGDDDGPHDREPTAAPSCASSAPGPGLAETVRGPPARAVAADAGPAEPRLAVRGKEKLVRVRGLPLSRG